MADWHWQRGREPIFELSFGKLVLTSSRSSVRAPRLLTAGAVVGLWATSARAADVRPEDPVRHIGKTVTVCGVVASAKFEANARSKPTLLDLGKAYPHAIFTRSSRGLAPGQAHLRDRANQRLSREARDRAFGPKPVDPIALAL